MPIRYWNYAYCTLWLRTMELVTLARSLFKSFIFAFNMFVSFNLYSFVTMQELRHSWGLLLHNRMRVLCGFCFIIFFFVHEKPKPKESVPTTYNGDNTNTSDSSQRPEPKIALFIKVSFLLYCLPVVSFEFSILWAFGINYLNSLRAVIAVCLIRLGCKSGNSVYFWKGHFELQFELEMEWH